MKPENSILILEQLLKGDSQLTSDVLEREMIGATVPTPSFEHLLGYRLFECTNLLENVLTTLVIQKFQENLLQRE